VKNLLMVALVAGAIATIIVQRERLQQLDREQLANQIKEGTTQIRDAIQTKLDRGAVDEAAAAATEGVEDAAEAVEEQVEAAAETLDE
jgi:K+-sensing histidine kinase KdpD